jgi:uncharacterized protein (DUF1330 family)
VQMLNLLSFKPDGGRERYEEYAQAIASILQGLGGRLLYAGAPDPAMLGSSQWDLVAIAEYPSRQAFLDMMDSPEYQAIAHLRTEPWRPPSCTRWTRSRTCPLNRGR